MRIETAVIPDTFGPDPHEFFKELRNIGDKNKINHNLDGKKSKLDKEIIRLEKKKSWLENEVDGLKSEISNGIEFGKKNLKEKQFEKVSRAISRITHQIDDVLDFIKNNL